MTKTFQYGVKKLTNRKKRMRAFNLAKAEPKVGINNEIESIDTSEDEESNNHGIDNSDADGSSRADSEMHEIEMQTENASTSNGMHENESQQGRVDDGSGRDTEDEVDEDSADSVSVSMSTNSEASNDENDSFGIQGRRVVEVEFFLQQLKDISLHNYGKCLFGNLDTQREIRNGLQSKIVLQCRSCNKKFTVHTNQNESTTETMGLNSTVVLATNMIGIGFSQLEQFSSVIDVPIMSSTTYKKLNDEIGSFWEETAEECMKQAAQKERKAAIAKGDVDDEDGIPFIKVITDACWSKRSYNRNYTALSGVGSIVGAHTGKHHINS